MHRRNFLRGISLGAAATLLSPALERWICEARGEEGATSRKRLVILTDGNGWGHQGMARNSPILDTTVRSTTDWDLPAPLASWAPHKERVTICRPLYNPFDKNLHGNGWSTLCVQRGNGVSPGGVSLDRFVAQKTGLDDAFPSIALGVTAGRNRNPPCVSADGPRKPFPAIGNPLDAHTKIFGGSGDGASSIDQERSLLDAMVEDINAIRPNLAGPERVKLEQLLTSYRAMEQQLAIQKQLLSQREPPMPPKADITGSLGEASVSAHINIISQALAFGLTHVAHLSVMGFNDHNIGWGFLGFGGDAHENLSHVSGAGFTKEKATQAVAAITKFKADQLLRLYNALDQVSVADGTMADQTIILWINSGGGKHHDGANYHPAVMFGNAGGALHSGQYLDLPQNKHCVSEVFLAVANAVGAQSDVFGAPEHCPAPLPGLLKA